MLSFMSKQSSRSGGEQIVNPDSKAVTLEHVLPQKPDKVWRTVFPRDEDPSDYIYRLGNLTLLTIKINHDAADACFKDKQRITFDGSTLAINNYFKGQKRWTHEEINERQEQLAKMALEVWKL